MLSHLWRKTARKTARTRRGGTSRSMVFAALLGASPIAWCGTLSVAECLEGSDFIANAASSRNYGMAREVFLARLEEDLATIQAFPPELRWFVKDAEDERFLVASVQLVFDQPMTPEGHRARFLDACFSRATI